jgi:flagellar hook assembly protein FlgD
MRVLMYLPVIDLNEVIDAGIGRLVTVPVYAYDGSRPEDGTVMLENVVLSDPYGQEIPVARKQGQLPSAFTLEQNYPNPFNPETNIRFSVNGDAVQNVRLVVYNILGQNIATLLEKDLAPGSYEASWDGTNSSGEKQASGVYFYSLIAGNSRETKKMVLAK